jgi:hypothetical protein
VRDRRIDFFRGVAIYMIFVDHVYGDPLSKFTYRMFGFSDAAELFVFLSGLVCGIVYHRLFARQGFIGLTLAIAKRAWRIYLYYALSSVAMILIMTIAVKWGALNEHFGIATEQPLAAIASALFLISPPHLSVILVLYIILATVVVPTIVVAHGRYWRTVLGASGMIWVISQVCSSYTASLTHSLFLFFNPFAWQFLFAIGVTLGIDRETKQSILQYVLRVRWLAVVAWVIVLGAFIVKVLSFRSGFDIAALRPDPLTASAMKANLSPVRLVHFLSVAYLVAIHFRQDSVFLEWAGVKPFVQTGMHSLEVFSLSSVLVVVVNIFVFDCSPSLADRLEADGFAFLFLSIIAAALAHRAHYYRQSQLRGISHQG